MERQDYIDELLVKSLLGEADTAQQEFIRNWRTSDLDNERYCRHFEQIWRESSSLAARNNVDVNAAWSRFQQRVGDTTTSAPRRIPLMQRSVGHMAAGLFLILGLACGSYWWWIGTVEAVTAGQVVRLELPDGSFVTMNKHSKLRYPRHFSGAKRTVQLDGEAFFSVAPDKKHPFLIKANDVLVRVVGTSFNVKSNARRTEVIVETGVVEVTGSDQSLRLGAKDRVWVQRNLRLTKDTSGDKLYNYYRTNEFICDHTPLARLVSVLEEAYGRRIEIADPEKAKLELTASYKDEGLQEVLAVVCETLNLELSESNGVIVIR